MYIVCGFLFNLEEIIGCKHGDTRGHIALRKITLVEQTRIKNWYKQARTKANNIIILAIITIAKLCYHGRKRGNPSGRDMGIENFGLSWSRHMKKRG